MSYGKINGRVPRPGNWGRARESSFSKALHNPGSAAWTTANLSGLLTVLYPFPYISGNPELVEQWNAMIERFAGRPVQFVLVTGEKDSTLLPFLEEHPIGGWVLQDPDGATGRAYGLEMPEAIIIGADRLIVGFDHGILPRADVVGAVLANPERSGELLSEGGKQERMPREKGSSSEISRRHMKVHVNFRRIDDNGGNFAAPD